MAKSPEGKAAGAHIKGKHMTYFLLRAYHSFRKIPLFGNILDKVMHVKGIHGEYTNVVGLPVGRLFYELKKLGIELRG